MKIFLIGYMASGKTTLGRQLAEALLLPFVDLDEEIEKTNGLSIAEIFARDGGSVHFREMEREELMDIILHQEKFVMATGGGAPCYFNNMRLMKEAGTTIFLDVPARILADRIRKSQIDRPIVSNVNSDKLEDFIREKLAERKPFYSQAAHVASGPDIQLSQLLTLLTPK